MTELILRPDLGKRAYRLKCRFVIGAFPSERALEKGKYEAADLFVRDMAKQDFEYVDHYGFKMSGPFPATETVNLPSPSQQEQWHAPSKDMIAAIHAGYQPERLAANGGYAKPVPLITETDAWEFELSGVFVHETILTEIPDPHEEKEMTA
ncbi:hypothetical protein LCGC14_0511320 [marine sediment metagenome]|uniref:Uncharacterized protein n=1 Tax=marine sediment metagenome TaxID=412755 RepID=A0A0F9UMQ8_9ZZZZ